MTYDVIRLTARAAHRVLHIEDIETQFAEVFEWNDVGLGTTAQLVKRVWKVQKVGKTKPLFLIQ